MGQAIGGVLPLALGVAISPLPIIAVVLMLATPRGKVNGPAFVFGWILGLVVVGVIVLLVAGGISASSASAKPKTWVSALKLVLGLLLAFVAARQWRHRPGRNADPAMPGWMKTIDSFTPVKSLGLAALLSGVNPKNLLLNVSAGATIAQAGISTGQQAIAFAIFAAIATLGPGIPLGIYYGMGSHSQKVLAGIREWMVRNNQAIMAVLCLIIGAKLIGDAIAGFTA